MPCAAMPSTAPTRPLACQQRNTSLFAVDEGYLAAICDSEPIQGTACFTNADPAGVATSCVPTFVGIGFEKSGSTKLADLLRMHPDLVFSSTKEANGWWPHKWAGGLQEYITTQYNWTWRSSNPPQAMGEFTPSYAQSWSCEEGGVDSRGDELMSRIELLMPPEARIVVAMRNPSDRAYSHYQYHIHTPDCWTRGAARCLPMGSGFPVAVCHAMGLLGGESFVRNTQQRLLMERVGTEAPTAQYGRAGSVARHASYRPWCASTLKARRAGGAPGEVVQPRAFPHWDLVTPGLYYDNLVPWVSRFGTERIAFVDMDWISSRRATHEIFSCLGLPELAFEAQQLRAPSNTQRDAHEKDAERDSAHDRAPGPFHLLDLLYARSNQLTFELTGVGGDWGGGRAASNGTASSGSALAASLHTVCRRCHVDESTGMTHRC